MLLACGERKDTLSSPGQNSGTLDLQPFDIKEAELWFWIAITSAENNIFMLFTIDFLNTGFRALLVMLDMEFRNLA